MEPAEVGKGFEFVNKIVGGAVPKEYIGPASNGMKETCESGVLAGYPLIDVKVTLVDGCLLYTSPSPRDATLSRMPSSA